MSFLYTYDRRKSPLLPLTSGPFRFLHHSNNRHDRVTDYEVRTFPLGKLVVASGKLRIADPFAQLAMEAPRGIEIPPGEYEVWQTLCGPMGSQEPQAVWTAYLSLVVDAHALEARQRWQGRQAQQKLDPSLPPERLERVHLRDVSGSTSPTDDGTTGVVVRSGSVMLVDADLFVRGMPDEQRGTWYSTLFEHGNHESWFSYMDGDDHFRVGAANFPLPLRPSSSLGTGNLVLSQTGWGDGLFKVFAEFEGTDHSRAIAYHLDFEVVPSDPLLPALG